MMSCEYSLFLIPFNGFKIEFDVCKDLSIEWTRNFRAHEGDDFIFVVAETWLRIGDSRHLIESAQNPGNLVEELRLVAYQFMNPLSIIGLEDIVLQGKWSEWMNSYWGRVFSDCERPEDDKLYNLLSQVLVLESRFGYISIYRYYGRPTIEVSTRGCDGAEVVSVWAEFSPEKTVADIEELIRKLTGEIRNIVCD
jgi:hypothetical protein